MPARKPKPKAHTYYHKDGSIYGKGFLLGSVMTGQWEWYRKDGSVFYGDQRRSREDALRSYTWNAAYAAKEETLKGSLAVGKLADITVLSKDILTVAEDEIPSTTVTRTIVGGKVVYGQ